MPENKLSTMEQSEQGAVKGSRKMVVEIPTAARTEKSPKGPVLRTTALLPKRLEEIKEDTSADDVVNHDVPADKKPDIPGEQTVSNKTVEDESNVKLAEVKMGEGAEVLNKPKKGRIFPRPLSRSNTDVSLLSRKSDSSVDTDVFKDQIVKRRNRRKLSRSKTELSLLSVRNDTNSENVRSRKLSAEDIKRPKTVAGWTKKEFGLFLPRKSFFSTHDNTLTESGMKVRSDEERNRPDWRKILNMRTMDELYPPDKVKEDNTAVSNSLQMNAGILDSENEDDAEGMLENVVTALSGEAGKESLLSKRKWRPNTKRALHADREEYKPLYDYLKHIHDNPEEYIQMASFTTKNTDYKHPDKLVRLGRAFRKGHHGVVRNNIYLHAISGLKRACPEATNQKPGRGEKAGGKKETNESGDPTANSEETEIEKLKSKAEKWLKGLSTQQFLRARELALKDIGEEDVNMTKWWLAFKTCNYIRVPRQDDGSASRYGESKALDRLCCWHVVDLKP